MFLFSQVSCKLVMFIHLYLLSCNYFWMLCEGIYLHTLIVVAVFAEKQHLRWYYLLGWGEYGFLLIFHEAHFTVSHSNVLNVPTFAQVFHSCQR